MSASSQINGKISSPYCQWCLYQFPLFLFLVFLLSYYHSVTFALIFYYSISFFCFLHNAYIRAFYLCSYVLLSSLNILLCDFLEKYLTHFKFFYSQLLIGNKLGFVIDPNIFLLRNLSFSDQIPSNFNFMFRYVFIFYWVSWIL